MNRELFLSRVIFCLFAAIAALTSAPIVYAQAISTEATAVTIGPASVVKIEDLKFGKIIAGTTAGTVSVDTRNGNVTDTGGVTRLGGVTSRADFIIYGTKNQIVRISVPSTVTITRDAGGANMLVDQLSIGNGNRSFGRTVLGRLGSTGVFSLTVGGRLSVGVNQLDGGYSGSFDMTVDYF